MDRLIMEQRGLVPAFDPASLFTSRPVADHTADDGAGYPSGARAGRDNGPLRAANLDRRCLPSSPACTKCTPSGAAPVQRTPTSTMRRGPSITSDTHTPPALSSESAASPITAEAAVADGSSPRLQATTTQPQRHQRRQHQPLQQPVPGSRVLHTPGPSVDAAHPEEMCPTAPLVHQPDSSAKVYPCPPWWWRWQEVDRDDDEEGSVHASWHERHGVAAASTLNGAGGAGHPSHRDAQPRVDAHEDERGDRQPPSTPRPARGSPTPGTPSSYDPSQDAAAAAAAVSSPISYADPDLYRRFAQPAAAGSRARRSAQGEDALSSLQRSEPRRSASRLTDADSQQQTLPRQRSTSTEPSVSSAPVYATAHPHAELSRASSSSTRRLRIYAESAAHPHGFAVPRRGPGSAAPVATPTWLATLPSAAADRSAIARAARAVPTGSANLGGAATGSHASAVARMAYRSGVLEVTGGVETATGWQSPLWPRYDRVHTGWREDPSHGSSVTPASSAGAVFTHTTTRLRCGATGCGDARPAGLHDPVSGLPRKPNEIPAAYLQEAVSASASAASAVARGTLSKSANEGRLLHPGDPLRNPVRHLAWDRNESATARPRTSSSSRSSATTTWADAFEQLAHQRRQRAHARLTHGRATHDRAGVPLPAEARRLYWAEHVPLHSTAARGLNAVLEGVGEAEATEEDYVDIHGADSRHIDARRPAADTGRYTDDDSEYDYTAADVTVRTTPRHARHEAHRSSNADLRAWSRAPLNDASTMSYQHHHSRLDEAHNSVSLLDGTNGLVHSREGGSHNTDVGAGRKPPHSCAASRVPRDEVQRMQPPSVAPQPRSTPAVPALAAGADVFRFSPLLTPLLFEVDACLRHHSLPRVLDLWRWGAGDQGVILERAGFTRAERQTILWELERTIRVSSTQCIVGAK